MATWGRLNRFLSVSRFILIDCWDNLQCIIMWSCWCFQSLFQRSHWFPSFWLNQWEQVPYFRQDSFEHQGVWHQIMDHQNIILWSRDWNHIWVAFSGSNSALARSAVPWTLIMNHDLNPTQTNFEPFLGGNRMSWNMKIPRYFVHIELSSEFTATIFVHRF